MFKASLLNSGMRGLSLVSKAAALLFIARVLTPAELGVYGLFVATIGYSVFVLGMEFYTFSTREFLRDGPGSVARYIRDQAVFHLALYAVLMPALWAVFFFGYLPYRYAVWFYLVLILEHAFRELYRILVALMRPLQANLIFFLASGLWPWFAVPLMSFRQQSRSLQTIWASWALSQALGLACAAWFLRDMEWRLALASRCDWRWIWRGVLKSVPLLGASLSLSAITTLDRFFIKHYLDDSMVGFYVFFANIAYAIFAFLDSGVVSIYYPRIVSSFQEGRYRDYVRNVRELAKQMIVGLAILMTLAVLGIFPLLRLLHRPNYSSHLAVYWIMLGVIAAWSLGLVPHYALYAKRHDKAIVFSNFLGLLTSIVGYVYLIPRYGIRGAAVSVLLAMSVVAFAKLVFSSLVFSGKNPEPAQPQTAVLKCDVEGVV